MKKILIITGRYLPGYKDGGPVRSIINLTDYLGDEYEFFILTCDRDHGDQEAYSSINKDKWNTVRNAKVFYVPPKGFTMRKILQISAEMDLVYVCGCFNDYAINTLILKRIGLIKTPTVVASMGLFSPLHFRSKYIKKKMFVEVCNRLGMFKKIYWSATSETEITEILQQVKGERSHFFVAEDLPRKVETKPIHKVKGIGSLDVVWISRIAENKNLLGAIEILSGVNQSVNFSIYGPVQEEKYWERCKNSLDKLPSNITWEYKGNVDSECVVETLKNYHVFLFPTFGENYGHVIQEALSAGCACVLSDQTPWQDLEQNGVGYVYSLNEFMKFRKAIESYTNLTQEEMQAVSNRALLYAVKNSNQKVLNTGYRMIFDKLIPQ